MDSARVLSPSPPYWQLKDAAFDCEVWREALSALPYWFRDPHKMDKTCDPRHMPFGSKIDMNGKGRKDNLSAV